MPGDPACAPYCSLDGAGPVTAGQWERLRDPWNHVHGLTNVWSAPPLNGQERYRGNGVRSAPRAHRPGRNATVHLNRKPLEFMRRIVTASTNPGDIVREPFGGLRSVAAATVALGRRGYAAERADRFAGPAIRRLRAAGAGAPGSSA